jgi:hypothetical protein
VINVRQIAEQLPPTKTIATVRDVARMVGLSPARFYQLQRVGVFPWPQYDLVTRRPHYTEEQQRECLEVRRRNCGVNGRPVLFYARRPEALPAARPRVGRKPVASGADSYADLISGLKSMGLSSVTAEQVGSAVRQVYPDGVEGKDDGEVLGAVFRHLRPSGLGR